MGKKIIILYTLLILLIPNVALCFTEHLSLSASLSNIFLSASLIAFILSVSPRLGRNIWLLFPLFFFAALQIVLLNLYGRSIIAVDMFLNLVTTNSGEVAELLGNMLPILSTVVILYVPVLISACIMWKKHISTDRSTITVCRRCSIIFALIGTISFGAACNSINPYRPSKDLYPLNVCYNIYLAFDRTIKTAGYHDTSAGFTYNAVPTHPADSTEIYIAIIGETSRAENWQLTGYSRPTTPLLSSRKDLLVGKNALSESNTTHKSVPMLLSPVSATDFDRNIYKAKSILTAFKEAGFHTAFLSNQGHNRSFIDFYAEEADTTLFIKDEEIGDGSDLRLLEVLDGIIAIGGRKQLIVLHTYGSHFNYRDRYTGVRPTFVPDDYDEAVRANRPLLINAYDNSILVTDRLVSECITRLEKIPGLLGGVVYTSDHGEDIYDDEHGRFLHASPLPTIHQVHVPFLAWLSPALTATYPEKASAMSRNMAEFISTSRSYAPTLIDIAGIETEKTDSLASLFSVSYHPHEAVYLNDHNECVSLMELL